jgi:polysaccharide chain length determinant protein (PEP-CTERM system associated)
MPGLEAPLAVWHRRKWLALLVFLTPLTATVGVVRSLPNTYESTTTVLVEHQAAPDRLVGPSAAGELETRLRTISEQILSRSRLFEVITQFDLYPAQRRKASSEAVVESMRRDIQLQFKEVRESTGRDATIAFSLKYRGRDPDTVAQVTNALAALYVKENARISEQQASGATEFLRVQLEEVKRQLEDQERRISDFKLRHSGELPDQQAANLAALERLNSQVRVISDRQLRALERRDELVKRAAEGPGAGDAVAARLAKLRQDLAGLRTQFTDEHPDVIRVKQEIAALESQLAGQSGKRAIPDDPAARQLKDARAALEAELTALRAEEQTLRRTIGTYEQRIENAPRLEQELQQLSRDYAGAKELYQSLLQRYANAKIAGRMEQGLQGEQFTILDPAVASREPVAPKRFRLLLMGLMVAMGAAVGAAGVAEALDTSFHTADDIRAFTSVPVLVSIPPITTAADLRRRRLLFGLAAFGVGLGMTAVVAASSFLGRRL